jgi:hypothetical protein
MLTAAVDCCESTGYSWKTIFDKGEGTEYGLFLFCASVVRGVTSSLKVGEEVENIGPLVKLRSGVVLRLGSLEILRSEEQFSSGMTSVLTTQMIDS